MKHARYNACSVRKWESITDVSRHCICLASPCLAVCEYRAIEAGEHLRALSIQFLLQVGITYLIKNGGNHFIKNHALISCVRVDFIKIISLIAQRTRTR